MIGRDIYETFSASEYQIRSTQCCRSTKAVDEYARWLSSGRTCLRDFYSATVCIRWLSVFINEMQQYTFTKWLFLNLVFKLIFSSRVHETIISQSYKLENYSASVITRPFIQIIIKKLGLRLCGSDDFVFHAIIFTSCFK